MSDITFSQLILIAYSFSSAEYKFSCFKKQKTFYNCIVQMGFLPWEIQVAFPRESQLQQSQPTVHAGCLCVPIIHQTLTWTTGSLTCTQILMHAIAHGVYRHT